MDSCKPFSQSFISSTPNSWSPEKPTSSSTPTPNALQAFNSPNGFIGSLEIFIHQARDIQNICIYHKQDVYAKLCLTSNPEDAISTKIINGGGRNPIFNENARLSVESIDSSLKCEIWMLSRAKNYLEDQLLGFTLIPLSEIVVDNCKSAREFSLTSTDLFHSPAGFIQLSISYAGSSPEVMVIEEPAFKDDGLKDSIIDESVPCEYVKIEFPDLKVVSENKMMVSEYFGISCANLDLQNDDCCPDHDSGMKIVESFSAEANGDSCEIIRNDTPLSCISSNVSSVTAQVSRDSEVSSNCAVEHEIVRPLVEVNIEPEQPVVQQEIIDMYMKSMQQFTESLANMKLPMDIENSSDIDNGGAELVKKLQASKKETGRVFYGSRAFF